MIRVCRMSTAVLLASLLAFPTASFAESGPAAAGSAPLTFNGVPIANVAPVGAEPSATVQATLPSSAFGQYGYGRRGGRRRNDASVVAMALGAAGVIAGSAVLVYANRPDCSMNANLDGCGYGTKVVGGAVISAGLIGLLIGALTWR